MPLTCKRLHKGLWTKRPKHGYEILSLRYNQSDAHRIQQVQNNNQKIT